MKAWLAAPVLLLITACDTKPTAIAKCEALLLPTLKAPSTYKLISSTVGLPEKDKSQDVFLQYDASNPYNVPMRDTFWCKIDAGGRAQRVDTAADAMEETDAAVDRAYDAAANAVRSVNSAPEPDEAPPLETNLNETPVCDRPDSAAKRALMNEVGVDCIGE